MNVLVSAVGLLDGGPGHVHLISPACAALGHACGGGPLPLELTSASEEGEEEGEKEGEKEGEEEGEKELSKTELITCLRKLLNSTKGMKVNSRFAYHKTNFVSMVDTCESICNM